MIIRPERPPDVAGIRALTIAAFTGVPYSDGTEADIVEALRSAGALTLSLVAVCDDAIAGHAAFSPVRITVSQGEWFGLGPVSVLPERQSQGIGRALVRAGLDALAVQGAAGCIVLGDPGWYDRFGFRSDPALRYGPDPSLYLQWLVFHGPPPEGQVRYHPGFGEQMDGA
jgi:putative acetyltransferase